MNKFLWLNLQAFADGTAGAGGAGATGSEGAAQGAAAAEAVAETTFSAASKKKRANPFAGVKFGLQSDSGENGDGQAAADKPTKPTEDAEGTGEAAEETFEDIIKGKYKAEYDKSVQKIISARLKDSKAREGALKPALELLAQKYGLDMTSETFAADFARSVQNDDSIYEKESLESGKPISDIREKKSLELEINELRKREQERMRQEAISQKVAELRSQEVETRKIFPNFNLDEEMENPAFERLIRVGINTTDAMYAVHHKDIIPQTVQLAASKAAEATANSVASGMTRPTENAAGGAQGAVDTFSDPSKWTPEMKKEVRRRVRNGEKIVL